MDLREHSATWDGLADRNAFRAILPPPEPGREQWETEEFFRTGVAEIARALARVDRLPVKPARGRALDFGCGVGRLSQALAGAFGEVDGVDVSARMVELARGYNRVGDRCRYHVNVASDLALFEPDRFDFIYSRLVLQHLRHPWMRSYVREFVRVLRPGGVAMFQIPDGPANRLLRALPQRPLDWAYNAGRNAYRKVLRPGIEGWEAHWLPRKHVADLIGAAGADLLAAEVETPPEGPLEKTVYFVTKGSLRP